MGLPVAIVRRRHLHPLPIWLTKVGNPLMRGPRHSLSLGKKQLNTLIGFLDKSGTVKDSLGGRENQALRTVRAKRELDEAGPSHFLGFQLDTH